MKISKLIKKEPELKSSKKTEYNRNDKRKRFKEFSKKNKKLKTPKILVKFPESVTRNSEIQTLQEENEKLKEHNYQLLELLHKYDQFLLKQRPKEYEIDAMGVAALTKTTNTTVSDGSPTVTPRDWLVESSSSGLSDYNDDLSDLFPNFEPKTTVSHPDKNGNETKTTTPTEENPSNELKNKPVQPKEQQTHLIEEPTKLKRESPKTVAKGSRGAKYLKEARRCKHCGREFEWAAAHATHENSCTGIQNITRKCDKCDFSATGTMRECNEQLFRHIQNSHSEIVRRKPKPEKRKRSTSDASAENTVIARDLEPVSEINSEKTVLALINDDSVPMTQKDQNNKANTQCPGCLHVFSGPENLKRHQKNIPNCANRTKLTCEFCEDFTTSTKLILTRHLKICRKSPYFKYK